MKALLVGINAYPGCPLRGCVNDVFNMKNYIKEKFGYTDDQIVVLVDGAATASNILDKLNWLVDGAKVGDKLLFHYSGHGAQMPTGRPDKPQGISECICPVDFDWSPEHAIVDSQFVQIFGRIPMGIIFNWVSDSCHSGTLDREMPSGFFQQTNCFFGKLWNKLSFWKKPVVVKTMKAMPVPTHIHAALAAAKTEGHAIKAISGGILDVGFIAGCRADQTSADTQDPNGTPCGALTYYLVRDMRALPLLTPVADIVAKVRLDLTNDGYDQQPQSEGGRASRPFLNA